MQLTTIITTVALMASSLVSGSPALGPRRGEIGQDICKHQYAFFHEEWIMQVPKSWWQDKFKGDVTTACDAWSGAVQQQEVCGWRMTECWAMDKQYPSGAPGWLHLRATTCVGDNGQQMQEAFRQTFDIKKEIHDYTCHHGIE